jgi:hypothetical protein
MESVSGGSGGPSRVERGRRPNCLPNYYCGRHGEMAASASASASSALPHATPLRRLEGHSWRRCRACDCHWNTLSAGCSQTRAIPTAEHEHSAQLGRHSIARPFVRGSRVRRFGRWTTDYSVDGRNAQRSNNAGLQFVHRPALRTRDERMFVRVAVLPPGERPMGESFLDADEHLPLRRVDYRPAQVAWVQAYVHNNADEQSDCQDLSGPTVAHGVTVRVVQTSGEQSERVFRVWVAAENTTPAWITDAAVIKRPPAKC